MFNKFIAIIAIGCLAASTATAQVKKTDNKMKIPTKKTQPVFQQSDEVEMKLSTPQKDADGDGFDSIASGGADCDDSDANRFPGNAEVADMNGHDEDCNPETFGVRDQDGDGYVVDWACNSDSSGRLYCGTDCDDMNKAIHPLQIDILNGRDDNCNGVMDEDQTLDQLRALLAE